ncbi:factor-independent urate hydroxylase [Pseudactinotalea terrae]|uniref:factor-independent urate hydroxylase n=1 Tax=Pseudactinotalea terrae TaxID=1743262 RepID=UPI001F500FEE|nr:urate oxidase [Pseudactinotalea terrae]
MSNVPAAPTPPYEIRSEVAELGFNQYGKSEIRLVHVERDGARHEITDVNVSSQLRGDFARVHTHGDNAACVATDSQKNTVFSLAREGVGAPEAFAIRLADHFTSTYDWVSGGRWEVEQVAWNRIVTENGPHDHSFVRAGKEVRRTVVQRDGDELFVVSGVTDLTVLKSSGSEFVGFVDDSYRTLADATDRIMATDITAWWSYDAARAREVDFDAVYDSVRQIILGQFAELHSLALQQTLWAMAVTVIETHAEIDEIRFSCPNNHHFVVDLSPFGQDNPNVVFFAADRPYGKIEAAVTRKGVPSEPRAWSTVPAFA